VSVQALSSSSQVRPGHHVSYAIWVWSTHGTSKHVAVSVRTAFARHVDPPRFTVCPGSGGSTCSVGALPAGRADELQARSWVAREATGGEQVQLTATASGANASSYDASGTVEVVTAPKSPTTHTSAPPPTTSTIPPVTLPPVPGAGGATPPAGLFPTISPSPSSSSGSGSLGFPSARKQVRRTRIATAASVVPLDPRLIGGQLAGLAVLVGAIVIAIARLSLRKPRPQDGPASKDK
jgi:hypothetical protein